jgi:hypothetical protein
VDREAVTPVGKIIFPGVAGGRVLGKAGRHDQLSATSEQLDARLIADLHTPAREERDPTAQIRQLAPLSIVQLRARRAHLIVEVVDLRERRLAPVAVLWPDSLGDRVVAGLALSC